MRTVIFISSSHINFLGIMRTFLNDVKNETLNEIRTPLESMSLRTIQLSGLFQCPMVLISKRNRLYSRCYGLGCHVPFVGLGLHFPLSGIITQHDISSINTAGVAVTSCIPYTQWEWIVRSMFDQYKYGSYQLRIVTPPPPPPNPPNPPPVDNCLLGIGSVSAVDAKYECPYLSVSLFFLWHRNGVANVKSCY